MTLITNQGPLVAFCRRLETEDFITVDTEFLREKTFWPRLCVVQIAGAKEAAAIDALAPGIDLGPVYDLLANERILKVFHAARQDVEIFFHGSGKIPHPIFDTQIAAMVCGFGDSVAYETLVQKLAKGQLDKSSRFTDWAARPLTERQIAYALADVTYLRTIYEKLERRIARARRAHWLEAELDILTDPQTYTVAPEDAWRRLKARSTQPRFLGILREITAWREREAQTRDLPRNRVLRDEALIEIAAHAPKTARDLERTRGIAHGFSASRAGQALLEAVARGAALPDDQCPRVPRKEPPPKGTGPIVDLLKVLLKMRCEENDVAQKLVASSADLEAIAADDEGDIPALKGWRRELFGADALALKHGRIALTTGARGIAVVTLDGAPEPANAAAE